MARKFGLDDRKFRKRNKRIERYMDTVFPNKVLEDFKDNTPKASGNARQKTRKRRVREGWQIIGDYPYSGVIDQGKYPNPPKKGTGKTRNGYSTQALDGIVKPTLKQAQARFRRFIRRIS